MLLLFLFLEYTGANASTRVKSADPLETLTPISPVNQRPGTSEEKEHPVVFVPGEINKDGVLQETGRFDLKQGTHVSGLVSENTARSEVRRVKCTLSSTCYLPVKEPFYRAFAWPSSKILSNECRVLWCSYPMSWYTMCKTISFILFVTAETLFTQ